MMEGSVSVFRDGEQFLTPVAAKADIRFHRPVEGEEGYEPEDATLKQKNLSSLAQIVSPPRKICAVLTPVDIDADDPSHTIHF